MKIQLWQIQTEWMNDESFFFRILSQKILLSFIFHSMAFIFRQFCKWDILEIRFA